MPGLEEAQNRILPHHCPEQEEEPLPEAAIFCLAEQRRAASLRAAEEAGVEAAEVQMNAMGNHRNLPFE